jgi:hypothetical protein
LLQDRGTPRRARKSATRPLSEGDTREETLANIREAIELYLEPIEDDRDFGDDIEILDVAV